MDDAEGLVRDRAEQGKARAGAAADDLAGATEAAGDDLDQHGGAQLADLARNAAQRFSTFAESLHERNADDMLRDARRLARDNPAVFIGGSIAVGFALSRLFKAGGSGTGGAGSRSSPGLGRTDAPQGVGAADAARASTPPPPPGNGPGVQGDGHG